MTRSRTLAAAGWLLLVVLLPLRGVALPTGSPFSAMTIAAVPNTTTDMSLFRVVGTVPLAWRSDWPNWSRIVFQMVDSHGYIWSKETLQSWQIANKQYYNYSSGQLNISIHYPDWVSYDTFLSGTTSGIKIDLVRTDSLIAPSPTYNSDWEAFPTMTFPTSFYNGVTIATRKQGYLFACYVSTMSRNIMQR